MNTPPPTPLDYATPGLPRPRRRQASWTWGLFALAVAALNLLNVLAVSLLAGSRPGPFIFGLSIPLTVVAIAMADAARSADRRSLLAKAAVHITVIGWVTIFGKLLCSVFS